MPLKNYTTQVSAMKSVGEIQGILVSHGASAILMDYGQNKEPSGLSFVLPTTQGNIPFRIPANVDKVRQLLLDQLTSSTFRQWDTTYQRTRREKINEQAVRVAWRILKDWVDAQSAIIKTEMVTITEVFLPYMQIKGEKTLYQAMMDRNFYLEEGKP